MKKIKSIMLIDDNAIDIFLNQKVIESLKFIERIQTFSGAVDALNYLKLIEDINAYHRLFAPQIILLDINMPIMDGFGFLVEFDKLKIFKQNPVDIFMLSSSLNSEEISRANNNNNVSGFISKPLTGDKLMAQIDRLRK
ncbi:MAG: response regulator [Bacteroidota bacterium]|nr:response regulator [Bacteroidota bacterium]MDP3145397.1 response regulator [Bacteroidota bacterium]MDP3557584.1 response regulator [Bacteroidota bacterium]